MEDTELILQQLQQINAMIPLCFECQKMRASVICDVCDIPCCLLCIKSKRVYGGGYTSSLYSVTKVCKPCYKKKRYQ